MRTSTFSRHISRYGLFAAAAAILIAALSLWSIRTIRAQHAVELLRRSHKADNGLQYSAISTTMAKYGRGEMNAVAEVVRAPDALFITYRSGERSGLHTGYNGKYFWRRDNAKAPLKAYAEVDVLPAQMAAMRLALTLKNYRLRLMAPEAVDGRAAEKVELRPRQMIDGARGPIKHLWIDQETGLTLRIDTWNHQRQLVMSETLSNLKLLTGIPAGTFAPTPDTLRKVAGEGSMLAQEMGNNVGRVAEVTGIRPPKPTWLPPGFEFENVGVHHCDNAGNPYRAALSRYSDGVNVLTIFAMKPNTKNAAKGQTDPGQMNKGTADDNIAKPNRACDFGPGTMVMRSTAQGQLVAVADLPAQTLERVLASTKVELATQPSTSQPPDGR
jgi:negative regulator of sigma E activity